MTAPDPAMIADIEAGAATLARAWVATRRDGLRMGWTEHDRALTVDGVACAALTGATGSAARARAGLDADRLDLRGLIDDARVTDADLAAGRWRGAALDVWLVDWRQTDGDPAAAAPWLMERATVGETRRRGASWVWSITGASARLGQRRGAVIQTRCPLRLGVGDCPVDLTNFANRASVTVIAVASPRRLTVAGLAGRPDGWATAGALTLTSGPAAGLSVDLRLQRGAELTAKDALAVLPEPGDAGFVTAGCDRGTEHCRVKFGAWTGGGAAFGADPFSLTEAEFVALPDDEAELDGGSLRR